MPEGILLSPLEQGRLRLKNRILFPGHQTLLSENGVVGPRQRAYYEERAVGGAGAVVVEGVAVHPTTKKFPQYVMAYKPSVVPSLDALADALHPHGCTAIVQLAHSGSRMPSLDSQRELWAPSDVRSAISPEIPHAVTRREIAELLDGYARTAKNVARSRCDGVEVHAAHEYLPGEFLSPINNRREDEFGGSLENRMRFLLQILERVRAEMGEDRVVGMRINGADLTADGLDTEDYTEICRCIAATGLIDYISVSAGTSAGNHMIVPPMDAPRGVYVKYAAAIKAAVNTPVFAVGRIKTPAEAEAVLAAGKADGIAMARALIADPEFPRKAKIAPDRVRPCTGCNQGCFGNLYMLRPITCTVNPSVGREREYGLATMMPASTPGRLAVVGGGPAGMEAAITAAGRGHRVVLFEADRVLGGQVRLAAGVPARRELLEHIEYQIGELEKTGVEVRIGTRADARTLVGGAFDHIVLATGSLPRRREFGPISEMPVLTPAEALDFVPRASGKRVVVIDEVGHFPAYVPAEALADAGASVRIMTPRLTAGSCLDHATVVTMHHRLARKEVEFITHTEVLSAVEGRLAVRDALSGERRCVEEVDLVVAAIGNIANSSLHHELDGLGSEVTCVGDSLAPRTILEAVREGNHLGRRL